MRFAQVRENAGEGIDLKKPLKINGFCFYLGGADGTANYCFTLFWFIVELAEYDYYSLIFNKSKQR